MKIFITGGSGFLGQTVIKHFINQDHTVTALSRSPKSDTVLRTLGAETVRGDLLAVEDFSSSLSGQDVLVHCGAPVEFWGPWATYDQGIITATRKLVHAAQAQGVKKFIHISSESVLQCGKPLVDIDESYPYPEQASSFYGEAKKCTEQELRALSGSMKIIILRPPFIYGPGCPGYQELFTAVKSGKFMWINGGQHPMDAVHVENLATAITLAAEVDLAPGIYFVTDNIKRTAKEFFSRLFTTHSLPLPKVSMPLFILKPVALILTRIWRKLAIQSKPPLSLFDLEFVSLPRRYRVDRFIAATGFDPQNIPP